MKKKYLKIILIIILAILLIVCSTMMSQAAEVTPEQEETLLDGLADIGLTLVDGIVGILLLPLKIIMVILGTVIRTVSGGIAIIGGADGFLGTIDTIMLSPENILFNQIKLTDINVFDLSDTGAIGTIRSNIAKWYYALRNLSIVILLVILLYVGIRMALSNVAEEEAKYKKMLKDWLVSFILVFLLHYIIIFTIWVSDGFVEILSNSLQNSTQFGQAANDILVKALDPRFTVGMGAAIVYVILCVLTLIFLIMYIKRMLTVSFLILIAPIITITYSIDKMGDGKSQAVNTWLKEFVYNVLIQPFHCLTYLVFGTTAVSLMNGSLSSSVLAIIMILFILQAEKILKKIFGFNADSLGDGLASAAAVGIGLKTISSNVAKSGGAKSSGSVGDGGSGGGGTPTKPSKLNDSSATYAAMMSSGGASPYSSGSGGSNNPQGGGSSGGTSPYSGGSSGGTSPYSGGSGSSRGGVSPYSASSSGSSSNKAAQVGALLASKGKKVLKSAYGKEGLRAQSRLAFRMTGAAIGATTGKFENALVYGSVGGDVEKALVGGVNNKLIQRRVNKNEEYFARAYQDYANQTGMDEDELKAKTQEILDMDPKDIVEQDRAYASFVYGMRDTYADAGERDIRKKFGETIDKINAGTIKPKATKA